MTLFFKRECGLYEFNYLINIIYAQQLKRLPRSGIASLIVWDVFV
jgi:hypothetical protein